MMENEEKASVLNTEYKLKDIAQFIILLVSAVIFVVSMNAKIDALTSAINDLRENDNKQSVANDLAIKALQNQVSTQTIQISLIQKDVELLKAKK